MIIYVSRNRPWNATYTTESGQVLYRCKATSAFTLGKRDFKLYRTVAPSELGWSSSSARAGASGVIPPTTDAGTSAGESKKIEATSTINDKGEDDDDDEDEDDNDDLYLRDQFKLVCHMDYSIKNVAKSQFNVMHDDKPVETLVSGSFFRKSRFGVWGRDHTFMAPDGKEYTWKLLFNSCVLYPASTAEVEKPGHIVKFTYPFLGLFAKTNPAKLEIEDGYEWMLDLILITFIYVEKLRRDSEDNWK